MNFNILVAIASFLFLTSCSSIGLSDKKETSSSDGNAFIATNYKAADALITQVNEKLNKSQSMIIATLVNIDDLNNSSTFGRLVSEQVSAKFTQTGYNMVEMKFRDFVYMKQDQGELLLTREIKDVAKNHNAQAVIVGTYALSGEDIFVNLKVIQPNTNIVIGVHDYTFALDGNLKSMARTSFKK